MSDKVFIVNSELTANAGGSHNYLTYELKLMLLEDTPKVREEYPFPKFADLPQAVRETFIEWVKEAGE